MDVSSFVFNHELAKAGEHNYQYFVSPSGVVCLYCSKHPEAIHLCTFTGKSDSPVKEFIEKGA